MKRYKISNNLRTAIKGSQYSLNQLSSKLGFEIKNIYYKNISINEEHLKKIKRRLKFSDKTLKEIEFNVVKNLGLYAHTKPIKPINKGKELAEFIGIMLGDGNIYKNSIRIAFDKRNKNYIGYVQDLCEKLFRIKLRSRILKNTNQAYLYYYNKDLIKKLIKFGLKRGNKKENNFGIPDWIKENKEYSKRCIKGLIDTDGCVYKCKREKQRYIKFTNCNIRLLKDFKCVTKRLGYSFAKANKKNACLYRKKEVVKFINDIMPLKASYGVVV